MYIPIGLPSSVYNLTVSVTCDVRLSIRATWDPATVGDPLCGDIYYDVMLSLSNGTILIMRSTTHIKFYFFSNVHPVRPSTHYNVTVASRNYAGVGESRSISISTPFSELLLYCVYAVHLCM